MSYESVYERFEVVGAGGNRVAIHFVRAGTLTQGDRPELFFFRVTAAGCSAGPPVEGEETVVGISGLSLARFERGRDRLTREQKIDVAGRWLMRQIESGRHLDSRSLYIQDDELAHLASELDFTQ